MFGYTNERCNWKREVRNIIRKGLWRIHSFEIKKLSGKLREMKDTLDHIEDNADICKRSNDKMKMK